MVFDRIVEYPLALAAACLLRPRLDEGGPGDRRRALLDVVLPLVLVSGVFAARARGFDPKDAAPIGYFLFFVPLGLLTYSFSERPLRFGLAVAGILASWMAYPVLEGRVLERGRSFFGSYLVTENRGFHVLGHGTTVHGAQATAAAGRRTPSAYYSSEGPVGQVFGAIGGRLERVAVVGLGAGAAACYARPGQDWTFYEIDPLVERIARDPRLFTYLSDCAPSARVVLGDARLSLVAEPDARFDLLVVDAFSSDAIPVHLITREAMALYARKLAPGGVLLLHLSNRNLDLVPVVGNLLFEAGFPALHQAFRATSTTAAQMAFSAEWVASAPEESALGPLARDPRWERLRVHPSTPVWTDDFSNVLGAVRWR
jgi:SAM-dependent methyltransferase